MMRKVFLFFIMFFIIPLNIFAHQDQLIISDNDVNETIIRDHFSLHYTNNLFIDHRKLQLLLDRIDEQIYKKAVNAILDEHGQIVPAIPGLKLDREKFVHLFYQFFYSNVSYEVKIPKREFFPRVDSELLADIKTKKLGSFITYYRESNKERSHNILLATKAINNHVVFPGERFSFNKVVGKRTKEKGYMRAPVIVKGELAEDIGGGICQVSSTLFNAVNLKGIDIVERYSHSRKVPYVPSGKDATVSWWGPDFVFVNNYNHPILIRASSKNGRMIVQIYSSEFAELKK